MHHRGDFTNGNGEKKEWELCLVSIQVVIAWLWQSWLNNFNIGCRPHTAIPTTTQVREENPSMGPNLPMRTLPWSTLVPESWGETKELDAQLFLFFIRRHSTWCFVSKPSWTVMRLACVYAYEIPHSHFGNTVSISVINNNNCSNDVHLLFSTLVQHGECWAQHQWKSGEWML